MIERAIESFRNSNEIIQPFFEKTKQGDMMTLFVVGKCPEAFDEHITAVSAMCVDFDLLVGWLRKAPFVEDLTLRFNGIASVRELESLQFLTRLSSIRLIDNEICKCSVLPSLLRLLLPTLQVCNGIQISASDVQFRFGSLSTEDKSLPRPADDVKKCTDITIYLTCQTLRKCSTT